MLAEIRKLRTVEEAQDLLRAWAKKIQTNTETAHREGMLEGELKGELEGKLDTAKVMLRNGIPLQIVLRCTGLTEDQLAREMKKDSGT